MRRHQQSTSWRDGVLVVPAAMVVAALLLGSVVRAIDTETSLGNWLFAGDTASARTMLSVVATASVTLLGLVFSITMLVVQMTSAQYSPRTLRTFLHDRNSHFTLGT